MSIITHKFLMQYASCFSCMEVLCDPIKMNCSHNYCFKCINGTKCPFCLSTIPMPIQLNYFLSLLIKKVNELDDIEFEAQYKGIMDFSTYYSNYEVIVPMMTKEIELKSSSKRIAKRLRKHRPNENDTSDDSCTDGSSHY